jgi:hypothetical protein
MNDPKDQAQPVSAQPLPKQNPSEEAKRAIDSARNLLERATENVKPLVQKELACEVIGAEIWNLRLRCK